MSSVNRKILDTIEESNFPRDIKDLLKALLTIEFRNLTGKYPFYAKDYDRNIVELAESYRKRGGE